MARPGSASLLTAQDLVVRYNEQSVLKNASLSIHEGDRIGLVGRNGSGKSTFLRIIAGAMEPDSGNIARRRGLVVGYLPQEFALDPALTVEENIRAGAAHVTALIEEFETLPGHTGRHDELEARINALDGWGLDHRIATAMSKLAVPPGDAAIAPLSGGEKRRVALCRAVIAQPDLLILDEPTNHLDADSIEWLATYLDSYPGAFIVVTHDRYFLDRVTHQITEISGGIFVSYEGNYTDYLIQRAERMAAAETAEHKRQMFLKRELEWVRRKPEARRTKSRSRIDQYFAVAAQEAPEIDRNVDLVIPPAPQLGNRVVELTGIGMNLGGRQLFSGFDFRFEAGQRIGITGRNGLGKTTLLKIILGQLEPTQGEVRIGQLTRFNYVDQGRLQLDEEARVLDAVADGSDRVTFGDQQLSVRAYLKRFLFTDDRLITQVRYLSGGERSRLLLARILKNGGNFLILDEPTNDLDLATLRVLEEALLAFDGVVLVVSHDRTFLNRICTGILAFEGDGRLTYSVGNYDYYWEKRQRELAAIPPDPGPAAAPAKPAQPPAKKPRKLSYNENRELEGMEEAILTAEGRIAEIEGFFAAPDFHEKHGAQASALHDEVEATRRKVETLYARWEELEAIRLGSE
ncbi:MAG TPA: ATP-binding cassette domain-containing protein [Chthoniobacteraceae bacterium]|nr:ATP-binding cassette domain-containing protein [Chthoniobacteraceae bacterium]